MKKLISLLLSVVMLLALSCTAFAANTDYSIDDVQNEMNEYIQDTQLPMEVEGFAVSL